MLLPCWQENGDTGNWGGTVLFGWSLSREPTLRSQRPATRKNTWTGPFIGAISTHQEVRFRNNRNRTKSGSGFSLRGGVEVSNCECHTQGFSAMVKTCVRAPSNLISQYLRGRGVAADNMESGKRRLSCVTLVEEPGEGPA